METNTPIGRLSRIVHHNARGEEGVLAETAYLERETEFEPATLALAIRKVMLLKGLIGAWFPHFSLISQHISEILFSPVCLWRAAFF